MRRGMARLTGREVKRDLIMHICMYYLSHSIYMDRFFLGRFSSRPGKAGSRFAQPGSRLKRDNFYHINTPSRFAGTILCWLCKLSRVKSSRVETFSCKHGMKSVPSRQTFRLAFHVNSFESRDEKRPVPGNVPSRLPYKQPSRPRLHWFLLS